MLNHTIGFYQFNNLVDNKVPFFMINLGSDLSNWYESIYRAHIQANQVCATAENAALLLVEKEIPLDFAIVVVCQDGIESLKLVEVLEKKGYTNVYLIDGGIQQMMTDRGNP